MSILEQYYKDGYRTGFKWSEKYTPGGPPIYFVDPYTDKDDNDWKEMCEDSITNSENWHRGFADGLKDKKIMEILE